MNDVTLEPYIFFNGQCEEAMNFYKNIFGGDLEVSRYSEMPATNPGMEDTPKEWLMHSSLKGGDVNIMASDTPQASPTSKKVELSLGGSDEQRMRSIFEQLGAGGTIKTNLEKQFWGDYFGNLTDKFGVDWMMNISLPQNSQ